MFKRIASSILATTIALTTLITPVQAVTSNATGIGTSKSGTYEINYWETAFQGLRMYLVSQEGEIASRVVDIPYTGESNLITALSIRNCISLQTKFGTADIGNWLVLSDSALGTSTGKNWWSLIFGTGTRAITYTKIGSTGTFRANGSTIESQMMATSSDGVAKIAEIVGNEPDDGVTLKLDLFNIANIGEKPYEVMLRQGYRVIIEPLIWLIPYYGSSTSWTALTENYLYGTPEGICSLIANSGETRSNNLNQVATYSLASYSLGLSGGTDKNKTTADGYFSKTTGSGYSSLSNCASGAKTGNGLHIYFADIEPEGGSIDLWDNYRYRTNEILDYVTVTSGFSTENFSNIANKMSTYDYDLSYEDREFYNSVEALNKLENSSAITSERLQEKIPSISKSSELALLSATNTDNLSSVVAELDDSIYSHVSNQLSKLDYSLASEYDDLSGLTGIENMVAIPIELEKTIGGLAGIVNPEVYSLYELNIEANSVKIGQTIGV